MSSQTHGETESKEHEVPETAKAAVLVESVPLPDGTPTVKGKVVGSYLLNIILNKKGMV
jgi:hypothetical protein